MRVFTFLLAVYVFGVVLVGGYLHTRAPTMQADVDRIAGKPISVRTVRRFLYMMALLWPGGLFCWFVVSLISPLIRLLKLIAPKKMEAVAQETLRDLSRPPEDRSAVGPSVVRAVGDETRASLVSEIRIELTIGGKRKAAVFVDKAKTKSLMLARGSIGDLLQSIVSDDQDAIDTLQ